MEEAEIPGAAGIYVCHAELRHGMSFKETWLCGGNSEVAEWDAKLRHIQGFFNGAAFLLNLLLQQGDGVDQLLRTRRASGDVDVHWNDLVDTLHQGVVLEDSARRRARPH